MSRLATSFVLGFHGCDKAIGEKAIWGDTALIQSDKEHDWLGSGVYFWENDPDRAREWAERKAARGEYKDPFVIGAVIDLGNCLDLLVRENLDLLKWAYDDLSTRRERAGLEMPVNEDARFDRQNRDKLLRYLDYAVIKNLHEIIAAQPPEGYPEVGEYLEPFDTVRGLFIEGGEVYEGSGFYRLTHTQIAVRNDECIIGIFLPR